MGNRGILHNENREVVRPWAHNSWVSCLLEFGSIKRPKPFSTLNNYSELFFLDEATAFAAGHRPCNYCQRVRCQDFKSAWLAANVEPEQRLRYSMKSIDRAIHIERAVRGGGKKTYQSRLAELPVGTVFEYQEVACLVATKSYRIWAFEGYGASLDIDSNETVEVLTPASIVRTFAAGFVPEFHPSLNSASAL